MKSRVQKDNYVYIHGSGRSGRPEKINITDVGTLRSTITVGNGGDFPDLQSAFNRLATLKSELNSDVTIKILSGTIMKRPLHLANGDYSFITIISEDRVVDDGEGPDLVIENSILVSREDIKNFYDQLNDPRFGDTNRPFIYLNNVRGPNIETYFILDASGDFETPNTGDGHIGALLDNNSSMVSIPVNEIETPDRKTGFANFNYIGVNIKNNSNLTANKNFSVSGVGGLGNGPGRGGLEFDIGSTAFGIGSGISVRNGSTLLMTDGESIGNFGSNVFSDCGTVVLIDGNLINSSRIGLELVGASVAKIKSGSFGGDTNDMTAQDSFIMVSQLSFVSLNVDINNSISNITMGGETGQT